MESISVIIPIYNSEEHIEDTINSVLNQTLLPNEIILINDGSTDNTHSILSKYQIENKNITVINQKNKGPSISRNIGVEYAKSDWVCFVDSDDILHPQRLEIASKFTYGIDAVICEYIRFNNNEEIKHPLYNINEIIAIDIFESNKNVIKNGYGLPRMLMKKDSYLKSGGINSNLINNEDHEFHFRMIANNMNFRNINIPLYYYRQHDSKFRLSNQNTRIEYTFKALYIMYEQIIDLPEHFKNIATEILSNRIANNALKNIINNPTTKQIKHLKFAKSINSNLKPYNQNILNIFTKTFGIGNLERIFGKLKQLF